MRGNDSWTTALAWTLAALVAAAFAAGVARHWFLGDDAFISFRYARHLAEGLGPVWNPGERVEGYTNFLWVVLMAGAIRAGLAPEMTSNAISVACGAGVLVLVAAFAGRRGMGLRDPLAWTAPLALAASRSFTAWSTGGLETMLFALLVFGAFLRLSAERRRGPAAPWGPGAPWGSGALLAAASLTRPEGVLFAAVAGGLLALDGLRGRRRFASLVWFAAPLVAVVGAHLLWRHGYYGAWLPNTFHAKVAGAWWSQGARYLSLFAGDYRIVPFLPLALLPLRRRDDPAVAPFLTAVVCFTAYVLYVGGDRFEFRFLVFVFPFLFTLLGEGLRELRRIEVGGPAARRVRDGLAWAGAAALVLAAWHTTLRPPAGELRHGVASLSLIDEYARQRMDEGRFLRRLIDEGRLPGDLVLSVGGAGALPYYTGWPTVDRRGINDAYVARLPLARRGVIAHERDAPYAYLDRRGVEMLDVHNRIVHDELPPGPLPRRVRHDGRWLPHRAVRAGDRWLLFGTFAPDARIRELFGDLEIVQ